MLLEIKRKCGKEVVPNPLAPMDDTNKDLIPDAWQVRGKVQIVTIHVLI